MLQLDTDDRLAIAALQSPQETSLSTWITREAAVLIPCAVIFWFSLTWNDGAARMLGPALYAGYHLYRSFVHLERDRRIGEILLSYEEERQRRHAAEWVGPIGGPSDESDEEIPELREEDGGGPRDWVAGCFDRAAVETEAASAHYRAAGKRFRQKKVPRGCAHALAALGHLQSARREAQIAAGLHANQAEPGT